MRSLSMVVLVSAVLAAAPSATAAATVRPSDPQLASLIADYWTAILTLPLDQNPYGGGDPCVPLSQHLIAPLVFPNPADALTCNVRPGTKVLVLGAIAECSNVEGPPFHAETYPEAIACSRAWIGHLTRHEVFVDGQPPIDLLDGHSATTDYLTAQLPEDNILGAPAQEIRFASFGYGVLLPPLPPGRHAIRIEQEGQAPNPDPVPGAFYMNVNVLPGS